MQKDGEPRMPIEEGRDVPTFLDQKKVQACGLAGELDWMTCIQLLHLVGFVSGSLHLKCHIHNSVKVADCSQALAARLRPKKKQLGIP